MDDSVMTLSVLLYHNLLLFFSISSLRDLHISRRRRRRQLWVYIAQELLSAQILLLFNFFFSLFLLFSHD